MMNVSPPAPTPTAPAPAPMIVENNPAPPNEVVVALVARHIAAVKRWGGGLYNRSDI
jgi:hypothetical protein